MARSGILDAFAAFLRLNVAQGKDERATLEPCVSCLRGVYNEPQSFSEGS